MRVESLETENFRLLSRQRVEFSPGVNVICGDNAQGKTTLLEAVFLLTGNKSFRTRFDRELIAFDKDGALLSARVEACGRTQQMELRFFRGRGRQITVNKVKRSASELSESLNAVLFCPDDLLLRRGGAAERRRMMDEAISQLRPGYRKLLGDYRKFYDNKSAILRQWRERSDLLAALDDFNEALCRCSARIIRYRSSFVRRLAEYAAPIHREFSGDREELDCRYATVSTVTDPEAAESRIYEEVALRQRQLRQAELDSGQCLVGAHKDDMEVTINGAAARSFASQGQLRTGALSLKIAEREIFLHEAGEPPVLLLDDVLSELDSERQKFVLNRIGGGQTLITCCDESSVERLLDGRQLRLEGGRVV